MKKPYNETVTEEASKAVETVARQRPNKKQ